MIDPQGATASEAARVPRVDETSEIPDQRVASVVATSRGSE